MPVTELPWKIGSVFLYPACLRPLRSAALKSMNELSLANPRGIELDAPAAPAAAPARSGGGAENIKLHMGQLRGCARRGEGGGPPPPPGARERAAALSPRRASLGPRA